MPITTTVCLGTSRELGGQTFTFSSTGLSLDSYTLTVSAYTRPPYPAPSPDCSFGLADCNNLWNSYDSYSSYTATAPPADTVTISKVPRPFCAQSRPYAHCNVCTVAAQFADVHYGPLVAIGEPCDPARSYTTATPTNSGKPNTAVIDNITFTSPSVYISFAIVHATQDGGHWCGPQLNDVVMGFEPTEISTIRFWVVPTETHFDSYTFESESTTEFETLSYVILSTIYTTLPFNFEHLMVAVPGEAYDAQRWRAPGSAFLGLSEPITDAIYQPWIAVPSRLRELDPNWSDCVFRDFGVFMTLLLRSILPAQLRNLRCRPSLPRRSARKVLRALLQSQLVPLGCRRCHQWR